MQGGNGKSNLFIGGVGATYSTPALLAGAFTGLLEINIKNFKIDDFNNVSCYVVGTSLIDPTFHRGLLYNNPNVTFFITDFVGRFSGSSPRNCANLIYIDTPNFHISGDSVFRQMNASIVARFGNIIHFDQHEMYQFGLKRFYAPKCEYFGTDSGNNNWFSTNALTGIEFITSLASQTNNGGDIEGDLKYMRDNKSAILNFVLNDTPPNKITNLSAGSKNQTQIQLNFTPPSSFNFLSFYEVWIDDGTENLRHTKLRWQEITGSGQNITGLTSLTTYKIKIVACDTFWNRSEFSNEITVTTL